MSITITRRAVEPHQLPADLHPVLARVYAARGIQAAADLERSLARLQPVDRLQGMDAAVALLAAALRANQRILIVGDFDADGATSSVVAVRALRMMGAQNVDYLVPNRFEFGYGLTPEIVAVAAERRPDLLITVDNGISSIAGVAAAKARGMQVLVTDHHLAGADLPQADAIVNPNQPGDAFPSKSLAGVGVIFYVMLALRTRLRELGWFDTRPEPNLASLLDLVALGTVADVVTLDHNNRVLVSQGLARMRAGRVQPGLRALFAVAGREPERAATFDLGFALGPRLNAAGRMSDMSLGIECLITDDPARALNIAQQLDTLNRERRAVEQDMQETALERLAGFDPGNTASASLFEPDWHQGVIGIVAGRIKEKLHRPVIAFARGNDGELKGSGRSISGLHLRDALDLVSKRHPELILRFGGHAMAAGLTIREDDYERFAATFEEVVASLLGPADLARRIDTDGALESGWMSLDTARLIEQDIWGQGFAAPLFDDRFRVDNQRVLKERHLKLQLSKNGARYDAIQFNFADSAPADIHAAFRLASNEYNGVTKLQLMVEHFEPL